MWPGAGQSTLTRSRNPVNLQGNNVVTQNVTGAREFRGNVGYTSPYNFRAPAGSTQIDSFLRRSSGSVITQTPGSYTPYYNRLSSYRSGNPRLTNPYLLNPANASRLRVNDRASSTSVPSTIRNEVDLYRYFGNSQRLADTTSTNFLNELRRQQRTTPPQISQYLMSGQQLTDEQRQILDQQLLVDPRQVDDLAPTLKYKQFNDQKSLESYMRTNVDKDYLQQLQTQTDESETEFELAEDFDKNVEQQLLLLEKQIEELPQQMEMVTQRIQKPQNLELETSKEKKEDIESQESQQDSIEDLGLSSYRTQSVIGTEQNISAYMQRKAAEHILTGEDWLSKQKFYRAADEFSTALVYKENPKAYAGKCHALFGAGEYMSSSFFLFLAIETDPGYTEVEIDIVSVMGGRDILENRLVDAEKWAEENDSADLHFLRAYFYYRIGRIDKAKEAIGLAEKRLPDSKAVAALKTAIEKKS